MRAGVFGVGAALPEALVTNDDLAARLDTSDEWIVRRTGIRARRRLNGHDTLAGLAAAACAEALADAGRAAGEVDRIIVSTLTPDRLTPGLAPAVAGLLGCEPVAALDVNAACAGFLVALEEAAALVESGRARCVLVCGAEALSRIVDHDDRATAVLFGDGAGAVVVAAGDLDLGCAAFSFGCSPEHAGLLYAERDERLLRMDGPEVYRHAVRRMVESTREALRLCCLDVEEIDAFVAHQANGRIIEAAAAELGLPAEKVILDVDRVANTSSASIPLALSRAEREGRLAPGARVALAAFGAGFVWGAGVMSWKERAYVAA
jgi:3-oxoacyl-[acyl-carrier-protein] synthase III